jgi:DNA polymerase III epsilon subunit-like protein
MKILFLDTETSGLSSFEDSIIEIAGVLVDFNANTITSRIESSFSSLVDLEQILDPKITRLTGISTQDLQSAPRRLKAQEGWNQWLVDNHNPDELLTVCGHSIGFDIGFLKNERWYLPPTVTYIDTLDLAKILMPDAEAINLEFLVRGFNLNPKQHQQTKEHVLNLDAHRALYDTYSAYLLFDFLIGRLMTLPYSAVVADIIQMTFAPLELTFYNQSTTLFENNGHESEVSEQTNALKIDGSPLYHSSTAALNQQLAAIQSAEYIKILEKELTLATDQSIIRTLCQIYSLILFKQLYPHKQLKFHAREKLEFLLLRIVLESSIKESNENHENTVPEMFWLEDFVSKVELISLHHYQLHGLIDLIDLYLKYSGGKLNQNINTSLTQVVSSYNFLLLTLQPLLVYGEYKHKPNNSDPDTIMMSQKLDDIFRLIKGIGELGSYFESNLEHQIISRINLLRSEANYNPHQGYLINAYKGDIALAHDKTNFSIKSYLHNLSTVYPHVDIHSFLSEEDSAVLATILSIKEVPGISIISELAQKGEESYYTSNHTSAKDYITELCQSLTGEDALNNYPHLIITGQNKAYKACEYLLINNLTPKQFLMVGESGSISKVVSKLTDDFRGIVLLKASEADFISRTDKLRNISTINLITPPYLFLKDYYKALSPIESSTIKHLHLVSIINKFFLRWNKPINYFKDL